jgi:Na+-driven multidrug efflux pump
LIRSRQTLKAGIQFVATVTLLLVGILSVFSFSPIGSVLLRQLFPVGGEEIQVIIAYLRWFIPFLIFSGITALISGLFIQWHRTGVFTSVRVFELVVLISSLFVGIRISDNPVLIIGVSGNIGRGLATLLSCILFFRVRRPFPPHEAESHQPDHYHQFFKLFWPMAVTSVLFSFNRPILFFFITRIPDASSETTDLVIAAVTLGISFILIFQSITNQYRNVGATFSREDPVGTRNFNIELNLVLTLLLLLAILSPFMNLFLYHLQNARGEVLEAARLAVLIMLPTHLIIAFRNYFHGLAMVHGKTGIMGFAGLNRNVTTALLSFFFLQIGWLNVAGASTVMVMGFVAEAATVGFLQKWNRKKGNGPEPDSVY